MASSAVHSNARPTPVNVRPSARLYGAVCYVPPCHLFLRLMRPSARTIWPLAAALVVADCASKRAVEAALPAPGASRPVVDGVLRFTLAYNQGAAFSSHFGPYQRWVLIAVTLGILAALVRNVPRAVAAGRAATLGVALVAGGALGNLLDRVASDRGVVDFIDVGVGSARFYVFNLADVGVSTGAALLAYALWRRSNASA